MLRFRFHRLGMPLKKQAEASQADASSVKDSAGQARTSNAEPKFYKSSVDGKIHTITFPSNDRWQKHAIASALAPMISDYKFVWYVHNFALFKTLHMTMPVPHACYSFLQQAPPEINLEDFDLSHRELFVKRKRRANGRFAKGPGKESTDFFSATSIALGRIGGGALASSLVYGLVTGKNLSDSFYKRRVLQEQRCCERDCRAIFSRSYWRICSNIKVIK